MAILTRPSADITGIKNADNITATYASAAVAASAVGTYPIVPTLVDPRRSSAITPSPRITER